MLPFPSCGTALMSHPPLRGRGAVWLWWFPSEGFECCCSPFAVLPSLLDRLGDSKDSVREQDQTLLLKIMEQAANPQVCFTALCGVWERSCLKWSCLSISVVGVLVLCVDVNFLLSLLSECSPMAVSNALVSLWLCYEWFICENAIEWLGGQGLHGSVWMLLGFIKEQSV